MEDEDRDGQEEGKSRRKESRAASLLRARKKVINTYWLVLRAVLNVLARASDVNGKAV